jgi:hypothetical protein
MDDKRDLTISNEIKKQKQSSIMEKKNAKKKEKYISPELKMHRFALEKGFAVSCSLGSALEEPENTDGSMEVLEDGFTF